MKGDNHDLTKKVAFKSPLMHLVVGMNIKNSEWSGWV